VLTTAYTAGLRVSEAVGLKVTSIDSQRMLIRIGLHEPATFAHYLAKHAKRPFAGPHQVLDYLGRYTHRVAIGNRRLLVCENGCVRFRWKDYRANNKRKVMALDANEFIRRFLLHTLPKGFCRIRHFRQTPAASAS
jgi:hypothetical protein